MYMSFRLRSISLSVQEATFLEGLIQSGGRSGQIANNLAKIRVSDIVIAPIKVPEFMRTTCAIVTTDTPHRPLYPTPGVIG